MKPDIDTVLFDLGKVLLDWDPRYFYRTRFGGDDAAMERFLTEAVPSSWVLETDAGKPIAQAVAERSRLYPQHAGNLALWDAGWNSMLRGEIEGTAAIVSSLKTRGRRLFALTNFPLKHGRAHCNAAHRWHCSKTRLCRGNTAW